MLRGFRRQFGISAPRLRAQIHLSWPWRMTAWVVALSVVGALIWWGFDSGRLFAGIDRSTAEHERTLLHQEVAALRAENSDLRMRLVTLESELQIAKGAQTMLSKQALGLQAENTQLKEDLVFLQRLMADAGREVAPSIQRVQVQRAATDAYRFRVLVVNGGSPGDEFSGRLQLQVNLVQGGQRSLLTLPDDQPSGGLAMNLAFKYYQSVEGTFSVPPGSQVTSVQARLFEAGKAAPRATQIFNVIS